MSPYFLTGRMTKVLPYFLAAALMCTAIDVAASQHVECPKSINGNAVQLTNPPEGWRPFVPDSLYLHSAVPIDGPPEQLGDLTEFSEHRRGNMTSYTYPLNSRFPDGKWIKCAYGVNGEVTLSKQINDNIKQCTFVYRKGIKAGQNDIEISCE